MIEMDFLPFSERIDKLCLPFMYPAVCRKRQMDLFKTRRRVNTLPLLRDKLWTSSLRNDLIVLLTAPEIAAHLSQSSVEINHSWQHWENHKDLWEKSEFNYFVSLVCVFFSHCCRCFSAEHIVLTVIDVTHKCCSVEAYTHDFIDAWTCLSGRISKCVGLCQMKSQIVWTSGQELTFTASANGLLNITHWASDRVESNQVTSTSTKCKFWTLLFYLITF